MNVMTTKLSIQDIFVLDCDFVDAMQVFSNANANALKVVCNVIQCNLRKSSPTTFSFPFFWFSFVSRYQTPKPTVKRGPSKPTCVSCASPSFKILTDVSTASVRAFCVPSCSRTLSSLPDRLIPSLQILFRHRNSTAGKNLLTPNPLINPSPCALPVLLCSPSSSSSMFILTPRPPSPGAILKL